MVAAAKYPPIHLVAEPGGKRSLCGTADKAPRRWAFHPGTVNVVADGRACPDCVDQL